MIVRRVRDGDGVAIHALVARAFGREAEAALVDALVREGDAEIALVAEADGVLIGHVLFSRMGAPFRALALAPLSVDPGAQGRGVGSALVREALRVAHRSGWAGVFVLGAPAYYRRFGFDATTAAGFQSPYAGEHFMALLLADGLPAHGGRLRHAPAFGALD